MIVPSSNSPEYNDQKVFSVQMFADLDRYLKTQVCEHRNSSYLFIKLCNN